MRTISQVLDRAKKVQKVPSDYKLALCLGIGESALANYRHGRSLPDEKACIKLAGALGEDPALLTVEMQAQRAKDADTRKLWEGIALRLQKGFANVSLMLALAIVLGAAYAPPVRAAAVDLFGEGGSLYIMLSASFRLMVRLRPGFVKMCKVAANVSRNPHPAALRPA